MVNKARSAKAKGRKFQQLIRDKIIELLEPYGVVAEDVKSTAMGQGGVDVQLSPYAQSLLPIAIECKHHKSMAVYGLFEQAKANATEELDPVLFIKADRKEPLVVMTLGNYLILEGDRLQWEH